jgi:hypothetical protein
MYTQAAVLAFSVCPGVGPADLEAVRGPAQKAMNERLKRISVRIDELSKFIGTQQEIEKQEDDPAELELKAKVEQGKLLGNELEYGKDSTAVQARLREMVRAFDDCQRVKDVIAAQKTVVRDRCAAGAGGQGR